MKRASSPWQVVLLFLLLTLLALTACTRPARTDDAPTPTVGPDILQPTVDPALATPITPPVDQPTPDGSVPVEQPTVDPNAPVPTIDPNAPTVDPALTPVVVETATTELPTAPGEPTTYSVQAGDTMGRIAEQFGLSLQDLIAANPQITSPDSIQIGDVVNIPGAGGVTPQTGDRVHTVQAGETLYRIGLLYGCTPEQLAQHNNITNPERIDVGQQLSIPICE